NANGNIIWENTYGGTEFESARNISRRSNGQYVIVSSSRSSNNMVSANYGVNDAWVIVIDEEGALLFEKNLGGSELDFGLDVIETSNNELVMVGNTESANGDLTQNKGGKDAFVVKIK
ncbi:MAG: hypothetical protein R3359_12415, partial [Marinirhabdus sp.]|nr:hypothetical protein [Marinirhabdus sp.]